MDSMNLKVSASPHVRSKTSTSDIMFDVILALVPATVFGIYQFGRHAAILVAACILSAVLFEYLFQYFMNKKVTISDYSAVLTGLLLALNLPSEFPVWMAILGSGFAIIIVKQLFGGLGQNFMNPALGARCFLLLSFSRHMTNFVLDGISTATPLTVLKAGGEVDVKDMFFGYIGGTIGETCTLALLIGGLYLVARKVISIKIPLVYIGTFAICIAIYAITKDYDVAHYTLAHLCGGGLMLGAWFMATDYVTSPITSNGKIIYGIILGLLTFVLRIFGGSAEGVSYAIIISNLLVPLIENATVPKAFGVVKEKKSDEEAKDSKEATSDKEETSKEEEKPKEKFDIKGILIAIVAIGVITVIMGAALGAVYNLTKEPIADANLKAKQDAYKAVYEEAEEVKLIEGINYDLLYQDMAKEGYGNITIDEINEVVVGGDSVGLILLLTNSSGYGGNIQMAIGIDLNCEIQGIAFLELNETAGLGMNADTEEFKNQFVDKQVPEFKYTKLGASTDEEIDAISGATITTSAVVETINAAIDLTNKAVGR